MGHRSAQCAKLQPQSFHKTDRHPPRIPVSFLHNHLDNILRGISHNITFFNKRFQTK